MVHTPDEARKVLHSLVDAIQDGDPSIGALIDFSQQWKLKGNACLEQIRQGFGYHDSLLETLKAINSEHNIETLLQLIVDKAIDIVGAERGFILVKKHRIARNFSGENIHGEMKISLSVARQVEKEGKALITDNARYDPKFSASLSVQEHRLVSILCVPIFLKKKIIGSIYLDNRLVKGQFKELDAEILSAFAEQAGIALHNAQLHRKLMERSQELHLINQQLHQKVESQTEELTIVNQQLKKWTQSHCYKDIHTRNKKMKQIFVTLEKISSYQLPVLIQGESGTGKELIARAVHSSSARQDKIFLSENCAAIAENLFESELFGYEAGAFTGATKAKKGLFEAASSGTLFLDEIGELTLSSQKKLLRVLEEKCLRRVGSRKTISIDTRIICATNQNLQKLVKKGAFREDLYYRLNGIKIELPPLRERKEDIPLLVDHFVREAAKANHSQAKPVQSELLALFMEYNWPGNIRQLRNEVIRLMALCRSELTVRYVSEEIQGQLPTNNIREGKVQNLPQLLRNIEKQEIIKAMQLTGQNKSQSAQLLGISRFSLQRKIEKWKV